MNYPLSRKKLSTKQCESVFPSCYQSHLLKSLGKHEPAFLIDKLLLIPLEPFHQRWLVFSGPRQRTLILAPRGHGKSTVLNIGYVVWKVLTDPNVRVLILSNTQSQASSFLREIKQRLEAPEIVKLYGPQRGSKWTETEIIVTQCTRPGKEATITAMGVDGAIISRHFDLIILDDIVDQENARTESQREKLREWYYVTLLPTLEPEGEMRIIGTRYHLRDLYGHLSEGPLADSYLCERALGSDGRPLWPGKFDSNWLKARRDEAGPVIFNAQYQNDVELMRGRTFKSEWMKHYSVPPSHLKVAIGIDPAIGRTDRHDYFAACAVGVDDTGDIYVLESFRGRYTFEEQIKQVINMYDRHHLPNRPVIRVGVEATAYQEALPQRLRERTRMPVVSIKPAVDKISRAQALTAFFETGRVYFPDRPGCDALIEELLLFPEGEHDDLFDALEIAINLTENSTNWRDLVPKKHLEVSPQ